MRDWMRLCSGVGAGVVLVFALWLAPVPEVRAAINAQNLGAKYDGTQSNITFRVYSSRATRMEVAIYKTASGAQEVVRYVLTRDASNVWSKTASVATSGTATASPARSITAIALGPELP